MAAYCTESDLETRFGTNLLRRLTDYDGDGRQDSKSVQRAIDDAEGLIDSYLQERYAVPLSTVPEVIKKVCADLALYNLQLSRQSVTDDMRARQDDILSWLSKVASGTVSLGIDEDLDESAGATGVEFEADSQTFGRDKPL